MQFTNIVTSERFVTSCILLPQIKCFDVSRLCFELLIRSGSLESGVTIFHSSVLELRKNQFLKKINVLKTFLEIETTHYLEGLDLKLNNETYAKVPNL